MSDPLVGMSEIKGTVFRGLLAGLRDLKLWDGVYATAAPDLRALMDHPPIASEWLSGAPLTRIHLQVEKQHGAAKLKELVKASQGSILRIVLPAIQGFLRLFGTSPSVILARMQLLSGSMARGTEFEYTEVGKVEGRMRVTFLGMREPLSCVLVSLEASLELAAEMCGKRATVRLEHTAPSPRGVQATYRVTW